MSNKEKIKIIADKMKAHTEKYGFPTKPKKNKGDNKSKWLHGMFTMYFFYLKVLG